MTARFVAPSLRKISVLALALGIAAVATLLSAPPAEAKRMTCLQKYHGCQTRCLRSGELASNGWYNCLNRTCNPQFDNCSGTR